MASDGKVLAFEELAKHNQRNDCWILLFGKVYDVTSFLDDHPGGDEVVLTATEKDATNDFEDVGHSDSAREMLEKYYIGEIDSTTIPTQQGFKITPPSQATANQSSGLMIKLIQFLVPLLILGLAVVFRNYTKKD